SLYNEDRNLLRIREKERRNQEALQERDKFPEKTPLFAEPYKTNKEDELSSRIQNMLGNYEEVKDFISTKCHQDLIGIPESVSPLFPQGKSNRPYFPEKTSHTLPSSFHHTTHHPYMGPMVVAPPPSNRSIHYQKSQSRTEPASGLHAKSQSLSNSRTQGQEHHRGGQEGHAGFHHKRNDRHVVGEGHANELQTSILALSPLLPSLPSPVAPLSPLHSIQHINSRSQNSNKSHGPTYSQSKSSQDLVTGSQEKESWDSSAINLTSTTQPSSQTFPAPLPSKTSAMQQKPTAYVRPMDGQDQAPVESPELKPLLEEYHREPYEKISDLKANAKAKLSKLEIPSEPIEVSAIIGGLCCWQAASLISFQEMTHSWPPPLTAIHTPSSTAEPSKFLFPAKVKHPLLAKAFDKLEEKQYDAPSKTLPSSQPGTSMLQDDLQLSDSEESSDEQVAEKSPSSLAPPSALQSQPKSVASAHSSSWKSGSTSDSDSSSDSETESSSSASEGNDPPTASAPEPDPPMSNKWQLDNWLTKVNPPAVPAESLSDIAHEEGREKGKEQGQGVSSSSSHQRIEPREGHRKSSSPAARAPQDAHLPTKRHSQKSPVRAQEPSPRQTVGSKRPGKVSVHEGPRRSLELESSDPGPFKVRDRSSRDKPKVKTKGKPKSSVREGPKPALQEPSEKKKHKGSHQSSAKPVSDPKLVRDVLPGSSQEPLALSPLPQGQGTSPTRTSGHKPVFMATEDFQEEKLPLPVVEEKLLSPVTDSPAREPLIVKIHLPLLSRVPQPPGKGSSKKRAEAKEFPGVKKQDLESKTMDTVDKSLQKRKREVEKDIDRKKMKSEKGTKALQSPANKDCYKLKAPKASCETQKKDILLPMPLSPMSAAHPSPKLTKKAQKRPVSESGELPPTDNTARNKSNHKEPLFSKHKEVERNHAELLKGLKGSAGNVTNRFPVPSLPNGTSKPRRPLLKLEKQHPIVYYMEEAKKLKHQADAMTDKTGKAFQYLDAALSFIEYGIALESDSSAPKSAYSIVSDTIDLLKFIMTLKSFMDSSASAHEKIFAVLCMRCQSILHMAMFQYKKDTAMKYSRVLNEHFKNSSRATQARSPCVARSTDMPSPLSPMPSPAGSVSSQPGSNAGNCSGNSIGSSVTVPSNIPSITSSYINITSYILYACDIWEHADAVSRKNKEFFDELSTVTCTLALNSSMTQLVHYVRQGLQWLRLETNTP
ncbi:AFF1 protein, partial [Trogon melanurus]|nr:AFF1 protein [Trogon melanurus]